MTYDNDQRIRSDEVASHRTIPVQARSGPGIGVLVAIFVALIIGAVFMLSGTRTDTASNTNAGSTVSAPASVNPPAPTTGSGATAPAPTSPRPGTAPPTSR